MQKHVFRFFVSMLALVSATIAIRVGSAAPSEEQDRDLPTRRPGLWRISTLSITTGLQVIETCVQAGDSIIGDVRAGCAKPQVARAENEAIVTIICEADGQSDVTSLLLTGDYSSWYRAQGKITSRSQVSSAEIHSGFTIDAKYLGSKCEAAGGSR